MINWILWRTSVSLPTLSALIDELVFEQRFAEVLTLMEPHFRLIERAARRKLPLQKLHDRLVVLGGGGTIEQMLAEINRRRVLGVADDDDDRRQPIFNKLRHWASKLVAIVPAQSRAETEAEDIARVLFRSADLRRFIARMRPYFAIHLLRLDLYGKHDLSDAFFGDLISDTGSVLYQELQQNQNTVSCGYALPASNRLLHFLFVDAHTAKQLAVWKPIGEHVMKMLRTDGPADYVAWLNGSAEDFNDERWQDPTFVSIFFFDVMVTAAACQGIQWHMWLYYFPYFVDRLEKFYDTSNPHVNPNAEFPTRSARLIYEVIDVLGRWVSLVERLPENSPHLNISQFKKFGNDNGNIPVSAAVALGSCMETIANSNKLGDRFAGYMHECIMRDMRSLPHNGEQGQMRQFLIQSIVHGGQRGADAQYGQRLATFWSMADHVLRSDLDDYESAIRAEYPGVLP